ncbi:MAG: DUF5723 family protein [Bacteroidota bacterium]
MRNGQMKQIGLLLLSWMVVLVSGGYQSAEAQSMSQSSRSIGMGGTGTAYITGYLANTVNPANLMLDDGSHNFTLGLFGGLQVTGGGSLADLNVYDSYLTTGQTLAGTTAENMLNDWYGSEITTTKFMGANVDVTTLGGSYRGENWAFGVSIRTRVNARFEMNKGFAQLGIYGLNGEQFSTPTPVDFGIKEDVYTELSLSYARQVLYMDEFLGFSNVRVYAGAAPKLTLGMHHTALDFNSELTVKGDSLINHSFSYTAQTVGSVTDDINQYALDKQSGSVGDRSLGDYIQDPQAEDFYGISGYGMGVDLGATIEMDVHNLGLGLFNRADRKKLRISLAVTDLGYVEFNQQAGEFEASGDFNWRGLDVDEDDLDENYDGDLGKYAEHVVLDSLLEGNYAQINPMEAESYRVNLPTRASFGAQLQLDRFSIATDIGLGLNDEALNSQAITFALGTEYKFFGFLPLRTGIRTSKDTATRYSFGTGLDFRNFTFDFGVMTAAYGSKRGAAANFAWSGLQIRF